MGATMTVNNLSGTVLCVFVYIQKETSEKYVGDVFYRVSDTRFYQERKGFATFVNQSLWVRVFFSISLGIIRTCSIVIKLAYETMLP